MKPLVIIPSFMREDKHLFALRDTVLAVRHTTEGNCDILVVDDHSPAQELVDQFEHWNRESLQDVTIVRKAANTGFSSTVNVGLRQARNEERDAVLMNADMEMDTPRWIENCQATLDSEGNPAAVIGALLIYPQTGLIQHAGILFSFLTRRFYERFKYGPANLPAALQREVIPVTGAFQYIRYSTLATVGIYDEEFRLGYEDVDYCLRVFLAEQECVYNPQIRAWHHESMIRGEKTEQVATWERESFKHLVDKYRGQSFGQFAPVVL